MQKPAHWLKQASFRPKKRKAPSKGAFLKSTRYLAVPGYGPKFFRQEVVGRPRAGYYQFTVFQLFGGGAVAVLIFLDGLGIDQVSNVKEHAIGIHFLAAHFFLERIKEFVNLD